MTIRLSPLDSSARLVPRVADQTNVLCPICGQPNPATAKQCAACGITFATGFGTEKVDAILEDLLDLAKAPPDAASGTSPEAESPDVDETSAEQLFDSLLAEVQPSPDDAAAEERGGGRVGEAPESSPEAGEAVDRIPVLATPADTEGRKIIRISGRMFDAVTLGSVGALVVVFVFFRMYVNPFDPSNPLPTLLFAGVAVGGMAAALGLFRLANSEVAQGDRLVKEGRYADALPHYERAIRMVRRPSYAWTSRGVAMKYLGRLDEALRCHENAIRLDATNEVACDPAPAEVRDRLEQQGGRLFADGPVRRRGPLPRAGDEAASRVRRRLAEPRGGARPARRPRGGATVSRASAGDLRGRVGLASAHREDVDFRTRR